jgi:hypothetical protein
MGRALHNLGCLSENGHKAVFWCGVWQNKASAVDLCGENGEWEKGE